MILAEFDNERIAIINPEQVMKPVKGFPKIGLACFSKVLLDSILEQHDHVIIASSGSANGEIPIYCIQYHGNSYAVFLAIVGASPCVSLYEEVMVMGLEKLILFGTCGVLDQSIQDCSIIIPNAAVRDEGTSYHYMEASDEIVVNEQYQKEFCEILKMHHCNYTIGKTWTTDAIYRETKDKMLRRKKQGCVCVDMECSAMAAVAKFRGSTLFEFFYAADNLDQEEWDRRSLSCNERLDEKQKIAELALELAETMKVKESK